MNALEVKLRDNVKMFNDLQSENLVLNKTISDVKLENINFVSKLKSCMDVNNCLKTKINILSGDLLKIESRSSNIDKWISDDVLNAYFNSMSEIVPDSDILILGPSASHLLKLNDKSSVADILKRPSVDDCKYIFSCVNNSTDLDKYDSGSHWSLLFCDLQAKQAYHFDSLAGSNHDSAVLLASKFSISVVLEMKCYQQRNSYECGANVLVNAKHILHYFCTNDSNVSSFPDWYNGGSSVKFDGSHVLSRHDATYDVLSHKIKLKKGNDNKWSVVKNKSQSIATTTRSPCILTGNRFDVLSTVVDDESLQMHCPESDLKACNRSGKAISKNILKKEKQIFSVVQT